MIRYAHRNFRNVPQTLAEFETDNRIEMNRGTENNMVVFAEGSVRAMQVLPPGQSGFVAPDGTTSPHFADHAAMFDAHEAAPVWFTVEEVVANPVEEITLSVPSD